MANLHVSRTHKKFGSDSKSARQRRGLPMSLMAQRAGISTKTLASQEKGETGVSVGNVAAVIYALGMGTPFSELLDQKNDAFGLMRDEERLLRRAPLRKVESWMGENYAACLCRERSRLVGTLWLNQRKGRLSSAFSCAPEWLQAPQAFALSPDLPLREFGTFSCRAGLGVMRGDFEER